MTSGCTRVPGVPVSYADNIDFGLIGCRRTVPSLQRLLDYLDTNLVALETGLRPASKSVKQSLSAGRLHTYALAYNANALPLS